MGLTTIEKFLALHGMGGNLGEAVAPLVIGLLLAEIVIAGGVIPMLVKDGYLHAEPFAAASS